MMKRLIGTAGALLFAAQGAFADHHLPQVQALETYACNFQRERTLMIFLLLRRNGIALRTTDLASPTKDLS